MKILLLLLPTLFGVLLGVIGLLIAQDCIETDRQIKAINKSIKQLTERLENEKRNFYRDFPIGKKAN